MKRLIISTCVVIAILAVLAFLTNGRELAPFLYRVF
jgi:hypothetical protein